MMENPNLTHVRRKLTNLESRLEEASSFGELMDVAKELADFDTVNADNIPEKVNLDTRWKSETEKIISEIEKYSKSPKTVSSRRKSRELKEELGENISIIREYIFPPQEELSGYNKQETNELIEINQQQIQKPNEITSNEEQIIDNQVSGEAESEEEKIGDSKSEDKEKREPNRSKRLLIISGVVAILLIVMSIALLPRVNNKPLKQLRQEAKSQSVNYQAKLDNLQRELDDLESQYDLDPNKEINDKMLLARDSMAYFEYKIDGLKNLLPLINDAIDNCPRKFNCSNRLDVIQTEMIKKLE